MSQRLFQYLLTLTLSGSVYADSGLYVGGSVGYSWPDNPAQVSGFTAQAESDAIAVSLQYDDDLSSMEKGVFVGYWVKDYLTIELDYARTVDGGIAYRFYNEKPYRDLGAVGLSADIDRLSMSVLPFYRLNDEFDLYGRIGYAQSKAKFEQNGLLERPITDPSKYVLANDTGNGVILGVGVRLHNKHHYLRVEGQYDDSLYGLSGLIMGFGYQF